MEKDRGEFRSPKDLNTEFRKILSALPAVQMSMLGTVMTDEITDPFDMTEEEKLVFETMFGEDVDPTFEAHELLAEIAKGEVTMIRRKNSFYNAALKSRPAPLLPYIKGTDTFRDFYVPREIERMSIDGVSEGGKSHQLYGNEMGGIFDAFSVGSIEEKSLQIFIGDINWYGVSPFTFIGKMFPADYVNDPVYKRMVNTGRAWSDQFMKLYKRAPLDMHGEMLEIP